MTAFSFLLAFWDTPIPVGFYTEALQIVLSLILIEGLLSVDNALGIAAMASHLPKHQQKAALRWGLIGAYVFRGVALATVAWLMHNQWVKWFGAVYLIYLAAEHLSYKHVEKHSSPTPGKLAGKGFIATIASIELMDLSLSLDNVVAAVGLVNGAKHIPEEYHIWVVCTGVFIGILALRIVAGWCIGVIEKFPVLNYTAFVLVGFVGLLLVVDLSQETLKAWGYIDQIWKGGVSFKFVNIVIIVVLSLIYEKNRTFHRIMQPFIHAFRLCCQWFATCVQWICWPVTHPLHLLLHKHSS